MNFLHSGCGSVLHILIFRILGFVPEILGEFISIMSKTHLPDN